MGAEPFHAPRSCLPPTPAESGALAKTERSSTVNHVPNVCQSLRELSASIAASTLFSTSTEDFGTPLSNAIASGSATVLSLSFEGEVISYPKEAG